MERGNGQVGSGYGGWTRFEGLVVGIAMVVFVVALCVAWGLFVWVCFVWVRRLGLRVRGDEEVGRGGKGLVGSEGA